MSEVTIIFSDDDKKNLEKYMEATHGGKWNIHDDFDIMDIMQVVLNDIDKKVNSKQKESFIGKWRLMKCVGYVFNYFII